MSIRYRVVRRSKQDDWEVVRSGARVSRETQSLPVTFKTIQQAGKWTDFINARDFVTGRRKRKPGRVKYKQHSVSLKTLDLDDRSRLKQQNARQVGAANTILTNTKHRLNAILKLSIGD